MGTGQNQNKTDRHIVTGMSFPSCGVKLAAVMTVAVLMEEATEGEAYMIDFSDWKEGRSGGGVPAIAFSMRGPGGDVPYSARQARAMILRVLHAEFGSDPLHMMMVNGAHDLLHAFPQIEGIAKTVMNGAAQINPLPRLGDIFKKTADQISHGQNPGKTLLSYAERMTALFHISRAMPVIPKLVQEELTNYLSHHAHRYNHSVLNSAVQEAFKDARIQDAFKSVFLVGYNHDMEQTEIFGYIRDALFPKTDHDSSLAFVDANDPKDDRIPVYGDTRIADAIMAITSIDGIIGRHRLPATGHTYKDMGDFTATALLNIMDEMAQRAEHFLQRQQNEKTRKRHFWDIFPQNGITPSVVSRLIMFGAGAEIRNQADAYADPGLVSKTFEFVSGAERAARGPVAASLRARYGRVSRHFTDRSAVVDINAPIIPAPDAPDAHLYPSTDIKDGRVDNLARLTWFGAHKIFKENALVLAEEMLLALRTLHDRGEWSAEKLARAEANIRENFATPEAIEALCERATLTTQQIEHLVNLQGPLKPSFIGTRAKAPLPNYTPAKPAAK